MTPQEVQDLINGLRNLADRCSEAMAAMHEDQEISEHHVDNLNELNLEVWRLRWNTGLFSGAEAFAPSVASEPAAATPAESAVTT